MGLFSGKAPMDNTIASYFKIKNDIRKSKIIVDYLLMILFIGYYIYALITNFINETYLFVGIYAFLLILGIVQLVLSIIYRVKDDSNIPSKIVKTFKYSKYVIKVVTITISIIEIITLDSSNLKILLTAFTTIAFVVQIIFEFVIWYFINALTMLEISIKMDKEESALLSSLLPNSGKYDDKAILDEDEIKLRKKIIAQTDAHYKDNEAKMKVREKRRQKQEKRMNND